jgi:GT2 family glycosyltransferase
VSNVNYSSLCVLILNYQTYTDTIDYVRELKRQQHVRLHILIVDNFSPNNSFEYLKEQFSWNSDVEVIQSGYNGGYAYGNNHGLRHLKNRAFDYIVISNNDIRIEDPLLLSRLIDHYEELENPGFVAPLMYMGGRVSRLSAWKIPSFLDDVLDSLRTTSFLFGGKTRYDLMDVDISSLEVDCLAGAFFMGKYETFCSIGLMDENTFLYGEETIIAIKVKAAELQNYLIPSLSYEHENSKTISNYLSQFKTQKYLTESKIYYHSAYFNASRAKLMILSALLPIWRIETFVYRLTRDFVCHWHKE